MKAFMDFLTVHWVQVLGLVWMVLIIFAVERAVRSLLSVVKKGPFAVPDPELDELNDPVEALGPIADQASPDPVPELAQIAEPTPAMVLESAPVPAPDLNGWPPDDTLLEMLMDGTDMQVADLLGRSRESVRGRRHKLRIPPIPRNVSIATKLKRRQEFQAKWGWWKEKAAS